MSDMNKISQTPGSDPTAVAAIKPRSGGTPLSNVSDAASIGTQPDRSTLGLRAEAASGPSFDLPRVEQIRQQISTGQYAVNASAVAHAMLVQSQELQSY